MSGRRVRGWYDEDAGESPKHAAIETLYLMRPYQSVGGGVAISDRSTGPARLAKRRAGGLSGRVIRRPNAHRMHPQLKYDRREENELKTPARELDGGARRRRAREAEEQTNTW